jgi:hypothetical protein
MTFIPIPDTALVRLTMVTGEALLEATIGLYFERADFTYEQLVDMVSDLAGGFAADLMDPLDSNYTATLLTAWDMRSADGYKVLHTLAIAGGASVMNTPLSPAECCVVSFHGDKRGKWNQGRVYVAGISEQNADQVDIDSGTVATILACFQGLLDDPPAGWQWVVASRYLNKVARTVAITAPVTGCLVRSPRFGFQRRRAQRP